MRVSMQKCKNRDLRRNTNRIVSNNSERVSWGCRCKSAKSIGNYNIFGQGFLNLRENTVRVQAPWQSSRKRGQDADSGKPSRKRGADACLSEVFEKTRLACKPQEKLWKNTVRMQAPGKSSRKRGQDANSGKHRTLVEKTWREKKQKFRWSNNLKVLLFSTPFWALRKSPHQPKEENVPKLILFDPRQSQKSARRICRFFVITSIRILSVFSRSFSWGLHANRVFSRASVRLASWPRFLEDLPNVCILAVFSQKLFWRLHLGRVFSKVS